MKGRKRAVEASRLDSVTRNGINVTVRFLSLDIGARPNYAVEFRHQQQGLTMKYTMQLNNGQFAILDADLNLICYVATKSAALAVLSHLNRD